MIPHPKRKNPRLPTYDYSQAGMYFVTICTHHRKNRLCEIKGGRVIKNDEGDIIQDTWNDLPERFPNIVLDEFTIMPNHIHGIIIIHYREVKKAQQAAPLQIKTIKKHQDCRMLFASSNQFQRSRLIVK